METFLFDALFFCFEIIKAILCIYLFVGVIVLSLIVFVVVALIIRFRKREILHIKTFSKSKTRKKVKHGFITV